MSIVIVLALAAAALPGFGQAAPAKQPQAKTQAEYNAYKALYDEQNPQKKAELGEKFLTDFKESDFIANTYTMIIGAYTRAQNWAKVIDAADRGAASPVADNKLKALPTPMRWWPLKTRTRWIRSSATATRFSPSIRMI